MHAIGAACVIRFAKIEVEAGMRHGKAEPGQQRAIVVDDVAIVDGDDAGRVPREHVAEGQPGGAPLPVAAGVQLSRQEPMP